MKKILLVEDDALLNKTLTYNLISEGYDIVSALNSVIIEILCQPPVFQHSEHGPYFPQQRPNTYIKTIYGIGYQWMGGERK